MSVASTSTRSYYCIVTSSNSYVGTYQAQYQLTYTDSVVPDAVYNFTVTIIKNCSLQTPTFTSLATVNYYMYQSTSSITLADWFPGAAAIGCTPTLVATLSTGSALPSTLTFTGATRTLTIDDTSVIPGTYNIKVTGTQSVFSYTSQFALNVFCQSTVLQSSQLS